MREKVEYIFEGINGMEAHLKDVYTELFVTEGDIKEVNCEHEVLQIDDSFKICKSQDRPIKCNDVFSRNTNKKKKIVLTKGIAGIGKTVSVHKFILDWAEEEANVDINCVFLLPFRKINCIKDKEISLHEFLQKFNPELNDLETAKINKLYSCKLAFIFDGLDESQLPLDFDSGMVTSVEERSSVDQLVTSLVNGTLLPSALIWITSRPAAANQISPEYVGLFTEVRGFTDQQKEEFFRKRVTDETQASRLISHIKKSHSLYIMCYIPVFCKITATVLQDTLIGNNAETINTTLTEMYIHFLLIQMNMKSQKHDRKKKRDFTKLLNSNKEMILKLAKLAFEQLKNKNFVFYEKDLEASGINVSEDFESTGMLTEIFQQEAGLHEMKVFCFVHLSVQEFLAAVHVFLCYLDKNMEELQFFFEEKQKDTLSKNIPLHDLLKKVIEKAMRSQRGHFDLFLRFLMGISLESNQKMLRDLFTHPEDSKDSITKTTQHITELLQTQDISPETSVNLFYCLLELNDNSLYMEILSYLQTNPQRNLTPSMCSLMACVLMMSGEVVDELNLRKQTSEGYTRLLPAVRCCRKAKLDRCCLNDTCCETVALALQIPSSPLIELDMSSNNLQDSGVKLLSDGLKSPNCQLQILRFENQMQSIHETQCIDLLSPALVHSIFNWNTALNGKSYIIVKILAGCKLTGQCCEFVASALQSSNSRLIELDMSNNDLCDSGLKLLSDGLKSPNCQLQILRVACCNLTGECCEFVASALQSSNACLIELDMSNNDLWDSGVKLLCDGMKSPNCQLNKLRFENQMFLYVNLIHIRYDYPNQTDYSISFIFFMSFNIKTQMS
uniref:NACHT domain-containing protein n=1 Tax=Sinocyclocheilus rhinocerous TaxID=307959 RepID=A0A673FRX7_9TELE